jgi:hypothetical protein
VHVFKHLSTQKSLFIYRVNDAFGMTFSTIIMPSCQSVTIPIMTQRFREICKFLKVIFFRQHKLAFSKDWVSLSFLQEKNNYLFLKTTRTTMTCLASCTIRFAVPTQAKNQDKRENQTCMFRINFDRRFQTLYRLNYLILNPPSPSIYSIRFFHCSQVC